MSYAVPIILAMLLGFLAGLLSFKVKNRWCPICGAVKVCPTCAGWTKPAGPPPSQGRALPVRDPAKPNAGRTARAATSREGQAAT